MESRYQRFVTPFSYEPRIDSVRASVVVGVLLSCLPKLLEFEAIRHLGALSPKFRPPCHSRRRDVASRRNPANFVVRSDDPVHITGLCAMHFLRKH